MSDAHPQPLEHRLASSSAALWLGVAALLLATQVQWWWSPDRDGAAHYSIAANMAEGRLERFGLRHVRYAPGYPLLIAPAFAASPRPFLTISLMHYGLALAILFGAWHWIRRMLALDHSTRAPPATAAMLAALVAVNVSLWSCNRLTISESAFMAQTLWGTLALLRATTARGTRRCAAWAMLATVLLTWCVLTRHVGAFVIAGSCCLLVLKARRGSTSWSRAIGLMATIGLPAGASLIWLITWDHAQSVAVDARDAYDQLVWSEDSTFVEQIVEGVRLRIAETGRLIIPGMHKAYASKGSWLHINTLIYGAMSLVVLAGWWRLRKQLDPIVLGAPFYVAAYIIWPFDQGTRFMLPLLPLLVVCLWNTVGSLKSRHVVVLVLIVAHAVVSLGDWSRSLAQRHLHERWAQMDALASTIEHHPGDVGAVGIDRKLLLMFQIDIDRTGRLLEAEKATAKGPPWLLMLTESPPLDRYESFAGEGDLQLRRRLPE